MPAIGPTTEYVHTENGTAVRNIVGLTWVCDHCHRSFSLGFHPDHGLNMETMAHSLDRIHWCEHTKREDQLMVEVWTCPDCNQTYRMPRHWEAAVFLAARRAAQVVHASRHGRRALVENRRRATDSRPPGELPTEWADPAWAHPAPERDDGTEPSD